MKIKALLILAIVLAGCSVEAPEDVNEPNATVSGGVNDMEISIESSRGCLYQTNEDGSMGEFQGGDFDYYREALEWEKQHPESYLKGSDLLFYEKLKAIEERLVTGSVDLVSLSEAAATPDINFAGTTFSPDIKIGNITTVALTIWDTLTLDTGGFADPFTIVLDGVKKQFTHEEFKQRLGYIED